MNSVGTMTCGCHHRLPTTAAPQRIAERIEEQWGNSFWMAPVDSPYDDRDSRAHAHQRGLTRLMLSFDAFYDPIPITNSRVQRL